MQGVLRQDSDIESHAKAGASRTIALIVAGLLVAAVAVNLTQFGSIQKKAAQEFKVFATWRGDLVNSGRKLATVRTRYDAAFALADMAPGATLIVPKGSDFPTVEFKSQMSQWGRINEFRYLDYNPEQFLSDLNIKKSVVARTGGNGVRKYDHRGFVLIGEKDKKLRKANPAREFIVLKRGSSDVIVDTRLVEKQLRSLKP